MPDSRVKGNRTDHTMRASPTVQLFYCRNAKNQYDTTGADANCPPQTQLESFSHDEDGNPVTRRPAEGWVPAARTHRVPRRVKGNLTADGVLTYEWDAENRLISVYPTTPTTGSKLLEFTYDYMGRRVRKLVFAWDDQAEDWEESPETDLRFVYDGWTLDTPLRASPGHRGAMGLAGPDAASQGWNVILVLDGNADVDEDGQPDILRKYTWGLDLSGQSGNHSSPAGIYGAGGIGGLLSVKETQGTVSTADDVNYWFTYDANGNVSQIVKDGTWALVAHYECDAYGNWIVVRDVDSSGYAQVNPFRFSTKWLDGELGAGLYYYGYRYYSPKLGRWVSRDPIEEDGGLNLYVYVANVPNLYTDVLGLWRTGEHESITRQAFNAALKRPLFGVLWKQQAAPTNACRGFMLRTLVEANVGQDKGSVTSAIPGFKIDSDPANDFRRHYNRRPKQSAAAADKGYADYIAHEGKIVKVFREMGGWSKCVDALAAEGRLSHSHQDFFMHAIRRDGKGGKENSKFDGWKAWTDTPPVTGNPDNRAAFWPSSYPGEHPKMDEPVKPSSDEGKARMQAALDYSTDRLEASLLMWLIDCGCDCNTANP